MNLFPFDSHTRGHSLKTAVFGGSEFSEDVDIYAFMLESGSLGRVVTALK